jgi:DNA-nicking Smr family endonuclease
MDERQRPWSLVDLHGFRPAQAERRLAQAIHAARVRGEPGLRVVTGRGWGNLAQEPLLRRRLEAWLAGPEGRRLGVRRVVIAAKGGALDLEISPPKGPGR